jgi:TonB family protein
MNKQVATSLTIHAAAILGLLAFTHQPHVVHSTPIRIPVTLIDPARPELRRIHDDTLKDRTPRIHVTRLDAGAPKRFTRSAEQAPNIEFIGFSVAQPLAVLPTAQHNVTLAAVQLAGYDQTPTNARTSLGHAQVAGFGSGSASGSRGHAGSVQTTNFGPPPTSATIVSKIEQDTLPVILYEQKPRYTRSAKEAHIQGSVMLQVTFSAQRRIENVKVLRGLDPGLDREAVEAVKFFRFDPATRNGVPVDFTTYVHIDFSLIDAE